MVGGGVEPVRRAARAEGDTARIAREAAWAEGDTTRTAREAARLSRGAPARSPRAASPRTLRTARDTARDPWGPSENWHITLAFYGEQPAGRAAELTQLLQQVAAGVPPFRLNLAGAGVFRQDVCWIGVHDPAGRLPALADAVRGPYATADQHAQRRFHVTVSRNGRRDALGAQMAALTIYQGPAWTVDRLTLYRSDLGDGPGGHPLYTPLCDAPLGAP